MDIKNVNIFLYLAKYNSFKKTAEILNLPTSVVSKRIRQLEAELGVMLLNRTTRKVELSPLGEVFLPYAQKIIDARNEYEIAMTKRPSEKKVLRVGFSDPRHLSRVVENILRFEKEGTEDIDIRIIQAPPNNLIEQLKTDSCDIIISRNINGISEPDLNYITINSSAFVAILNKNHRLADKNTVELKELKDENFLLITEAMPNNKSYYDPAISLCRKEGFEPHVRYLGSSIYDVVKLVSMNFGISLLASIPEDNPYSGDIVSVEITPPIYTTVDIVYRKNFDKMALDFLLREILPSTASR